MPYRPKSLVQAYVVMLERRMHWSWYAEGGAGGETTQSLTCEDSWLALTGALTGPDTVLSGFYLTYRAVGWEEMIISVKEG